MKHALDEADAELTARLKTADETLGIASEGVKKLMPKDLPNYSRVENMVPRGEFLGSFSDAKEAVKWCDLDIRPLTGTGVEEPGRLVDRGWRSQVGRSGHPAVDRDGGGGASGRLVDRDGFCTPATESMWMVTESMWR